MTIYGIHAYIISMNWSYCRIALGYNCLMMNIIQQVTDPVRNYLILFLLSYYCYRYCCTCYKITAIIVTVTATAATIFKTIILLCCRY